MARYNKLIQFYLTNVCNSKCKTCNIWCNKDRQEIPLENVINVIKEYPDADFVFGGGEFTLYSKKHELLYWCDSNNINYTVLSNAVSYNLLKELLNNHNIKNLTISCDGTKHDNIRGVKGNLKNIENIVKEYKKYIRNIKLSYTLSKLNEACIDEDMEYFRKLCFGKIYFCIAQNMDLLMKAQGSITPDIESIKYLNESYSYMLYDKDQQLLQDIVNGKHKICDSVRDVHTIYTNGDVVRCQSYLSNIVLGNIYKENFKEILDKDFIRKTDRCPFNDKCELVCQRRYDYEDRV